MDFKNGILKLQLAKKAGLPLRIVLLKTSLRIVCCINCGKNT